MRKRSFSRGQWEIQRERFHLDREMPPEGDEPASLADVIPAVVKEMGLGDEVLHRALLDEWTTLVGPQLAKHARPGRLERKGLCIFVDSSAWLSELSRYGQKQLLANLQKRFGDAIRSIRLQLDPGGR